MFDGSGGVFVYVFFFKEGDFYFDYNEKWIDGVIYGINLFFVVFYEIGYFLGLGYFKNRSVIMYEIYKVYDFNMKFIIEEKNGIYYIYGEYSMFLYILLLLFLRCLVGNILLC